MITGSRRDGPVIVAAILVAAVLPAVVAALAGAAVIPRNDDWAIRSIASELYRSGVVQLDGTTQAFAVSQAFLAQPILRLLDGDPLSYWVLGAIASAVVVAAAYLLARLTLSRFDSVLVMAAMVVVPGYLAYSSSFMTDVPSLAAQLACLSLGARSVQGGRHDMRWATAAILVGCLGFSIRQFAVLAPVSVAIVGIVREPRRPSRWLLAVGLGVLVAGIAFWHESLPGQFGPTASVPDGLRRLAASVPFVALAVLPVSLRAILLQSRSLGRREVVVAGAAVLLVIGPLVAFWAGTVFLGNLVGPRGVPSDGVDIGSRPELWTEPGWRAFEALAVLAIIPMVVAIVRSASALRSMPLRGPQAMPGSTLLLVVFLALTLSVFIVFTIVWPAYDRYLWPLVVPLGIVLLSTERERQVDAPRRKAIPVAVTGLLAVVSTGFALNAYAFDAARWGLGEQLVARGYDRGTVDAGYEWVGSYAPGPALFADRSRRTVDPVIWYAGIWPEFRRCAFVASSPVRVDGFELLTEVPDAYRLYLVAGPEIPLYLYGSTLGDCGVDHAS